MTFNNRIIWIHSFDPVSKIGGSFMWEQLPFFKDHGTQIEPVSVHGLTNPISFFKFWLKYRTSFEDCILHAQYGSGTAFFTACLKAKRKVVSLRGSDWYMLEEGTTYQRLRSHIALILTRLCLKKFDQVIVMSDNMKYDVLEKYPELVNKVTKITDGIDLNLFYPMDKIASKQALYLDTSKFYIGVGVMNIGYSVKRMNLAKAAFEKAKMTNKDIELLVLSGIARNKMNLNINACDLNLLTSIYEGWPNIIKEGLACNTPFVATNVSDLALIAKDENSKCYVSEPDADNIALLINKAFRNKKENLNSGLMLSKYVKDMEMSIVVQKILNVYAVL